MVNRLAAAGKLWYHDTDHGHLQVEKTEVKDSLYKPDFKAGRQLVVLSFVDYPLKLALNIYRLGTRYQLVRRDGHMTLIDTEKQ